MPASPITPVTVLTGFLGSGKTTLLNRWLRHPDFADAAVIVNEFGAVAIDHALVREASEDVVVLPGGCICCQAAGDLVQALRDLHFRRAAGEVPPFRRAIIETTGLADPAPLLRTLIELPVVAARYSLSGVVTTVDAEFGAQALDRQPEAVKQVAVADRLVLTKVDRAAPQVAETLEKRLHAMNPSARLVRSVMGDADPGPLFDTGLHRAGTVAERVSGWMGGNWRIQGARTGPHDARIRAFTWFAEEPLAWDSVETALETLLEVRGERILRLKGLVNLAGEPGPRAVHAVQHCLYPSARLPEWPDADRRTRLVFVTRDLEDATIALTLDSFLGAAAPVPARKAGIGQAM